MNNLDNPYIIVPLIGWLAAQLVKFILKAFGGETDWRNLYRSGGMPSAHTTIVTALAATALVVDGVGSAAFGISLILACVVAYDAMSVRRVTAEQTEAIRELQQGVGTGRTSVDIHRSSGHTPQEVVAGAGFGAILGFLITACYWSDVAASDLKMIPTDTWQRGYLIISVALVLLGILIPALFNRGTYRKLPTSRKLRRHLHVALLAPGVLGLFLVWAQSQELAIFATHVWALALGIWVATSLIYSTITLFRSARRNLSEEKEHFLKQKKRVKKRRRKKR